MKAAVPISFEDRLPEPWECFTEHDGSLSFRMEWCWQCKLVAHRGIIRPQWSWRSVPLTIDPAANWPWTYWLPANCLSLPVDLSVFQAGQHHAKTTNREIIVPPLLTEEIIERKFEDWWLNEGSGIVPLPGHEHEEHTHRVSNIAWHNGVYIMQHS